MSAGTLHPASLVDFAPIAQLLLLAMALGAVPLLWWVWRSRGQGPLQRHKALVLLVLFLTFDLTVFGAFTRLTDSGLGCPDWPGCYGKASPLGAAAQIAREQAALPTGPVTFSKAWIEMVHRYLAMAVGLLIIGMVVSAWRLRSETPVSVLASAPASRARALLPWALLTLVWVCVQGAFGALTVTLKLKPIIVTLHLLGAMVLLSLLVLQLRTVRALGPGAPVDAPAGLGLQALGWAALVALSIQLALGVWVSSNYAVLACNEFPTCQQGQWWPVTDPAAYAQGFELWRPLGQSGQGGAIPFAALTAIHLMHRGMAVVVVVLLFSLAWAVRQDLRRQQAAPSRATQALVALTVLQVLTGLSNVVFQWPLLAALLHTAGAAALVVVLVWLVASFHATPRTAGLPQPQALGVAA